jgi:glycosyltransferase involved in cell wall biosynthesis
MPSVYRAADAFIFPTLEDVWGLVANEAILCGIPVLCSKYAGCSHELFEEASLFDPEDADEFVAKLRLAISGQLPGPDPSRLRTTPQLLSALVTSLEQSIANSFVTPAKTHQTFDLPTKF